MSIAAYFSSLSLLKLLKNVPGGVAQGLIWGLMALGIYITFRLLDVADLTVDGSFTTGGACTVMLILAGWPAWAALLVALIAGLLAGFCTGMLHTKLGIPAILSGILTQFALYSVNLHIMGMAANKAVSVDKFDLVLSSRNIPSAIITGLIIGPSGVVGLLGGVCVTGFAMAVFMSNAGGAWDNAKKYIEAGHHGGKGSECHKAGVIGDTVGDPFKDTSGPSLNILIKLCSTVSIVFSGLIVAYNLMNLL